MKKEKFLGLAILLVTSCLSLAAEPPVAQIGNPPVAKVDSGVVVHSTPTTLPPNGYQWQKVGNDPWKLVAVGGATTTRPFPEFNTTHLTNVQHAAGVSTTYQGGIGTEHTYTLVPTMGQLGSTSGCANGQCGTVQYSSRRFR